MLWSSHSARAANGRISTHFISCFRPSLRARLCRVSFTSAFEVNIFARERLQFRQLWCADQVAFGPVVDCLAAHKEVGLSGAIAYFEDLRELLERKPHDQADLAIARATSFKLVIRQFAPPPTSEARR